MTGAGGGHLPAFRQNEKWDPKLATMSYERYSAFDCLQFFLRDGPTVFPLDINPTDGLVFNHG